MSLRFGLKKKKKKKFLSEIEMFIQMQEQTRKFHLKSIQTNAQIYFGDSKQQARSKVKELCFINSQIDKMSRSFHFGNLSTKYVHVRSFWVGWFTYEILQFLSMWIRHLVPIFLIQKIIFSICNSKTIVWIASQRYVGILVTDGNRSGWPPLILHKTSSYVTWFI